MQQVAHRRRAKALAALAAAVVSLSLCGPAPAGAHARGPAASVPDVGAPADRPGAAGVRALETRRAPRARILSRRLTLEPDRRVRVRLACSGHRRCRGTLRIRSAHKRPKHRKALGGARFRVGHHRGAVRVRLARRAPRKVHRRGKLRVLGIARTEVRRGADRRSRRRLTI